MIADPGQSPKGPETWGAVTTPIERASRGRLAWTPCVVVGSDLSVVTVVPPGTIRTSRADGHRALALVTSTAHGVRPQVAPLAWPPDRARAGAACQSGRSDGAVRIGRGPSVLACSPSRGWPMSSSTAAMCDSSASRRLPSGCGRRASRSTTCSRRRRARMPPQDPAFSTGPVSGSWAGSTDAFATPGRSRAPCSLPGTASRSVDAVADVETVRPWPSRTR